MTRGPGAIVEELAQRPRRWVVTGSAGFIGSHLLETLLVLGQEVVSIDNFATGRRYNLDEVRRRVGEQAWARHGFIEGTSLIRSPRCLCGRRHRLHRWLGSVPRSIDDPLATHHANATGSACLAAAMRASSACLRGLERDLRRLPALPKQEDTIGRPLSPYAVTKRINELYAEVFGRCYGLATVGLRYFNVFGPRQDPDGAYAAVIPRWAARMLQGRRCVIHGDGETSRDFCFVANVVQANLRAALTRHAAALDQVYNIAVGECTTLRQLHAALVNALKGERPDLQVDDPDHVEFRAGDVRHSLADIGRAQPAGLRAESPRAGRLARGEGWHCRRRRCRHWRFRFRAEKPFGLVAPLVAQASAHICARSRMVFQFRTCSAREGSA
jgi:UDP-N-acetylglucosamine 4-epimerase